MWLLGYVSQQKFLGQLLMSTSQEGCQYVTHITIFGGKINNMQVLL